ncbi:MAG: DeoR/GlpR family DNA-binding transcription regulator [Spirochaetota bacterium]
MKRIGRIKKIVELLEEKGNVSTVFLAKTFNISESSVRRDITYMVSLNKYKNINRVHGGIILDTVRNSLEYMFELKLGLNSKYKIAIAKKASEFIYDGDSIIIDSGTTCLYLAQCLHGKKGLRIITLDAKIAEELGNYENVESTIVGGVIRPGYYTIGGSLALENLNQFSAQKVFMSADAIDLEHGITNASEFEVGVKKKIIHSGKHIWIIVDYTKFKKHNLYKVADISNVHTIITNKDLDSDYANIIRERGLELILV